MECLLEVAREREADVARLLAAAESGSRPRPLPPPWAVAAGEGTAREVRLCAAEGRTGVPVPGVGEVYGVET